MRPACTTLEEVRACAVCSGSARARAMSAASCRHAAATLIQKRDGSAGKAGQWRMDPCSSCRLAWARGAPCALRASPARTVEGAQERGPWTCGDEEEEFAIGGSIAEA